MSSTAILLLFSFSLGSFTTMGGKAPNATSHLEVTSYLPEILREVLAYPLQGERVTLIIEENQEVLADVEDALMRRAGNPIYLLRLPRDLPREDITVSNGTKEVESTTNYLLQSNILVLVRTSRDLAWWPLWNPPDNWRNSAVLLISSEASCWSKELLHTSLLTRAPSVSLICPSVNRNKSSPMFRVWTWKPYAADDSVTGIGAWDPKFFYSWNRLFPDRFQDMSKKTMRIFGVSVDRPLYYVSPDGEIKGMNCNILKALSSALHFSVNFSESVEVSWTDALEPVKRGENDIFINFSLMTPERIREYHMSVPYLLEGYAIMLEVPPPLPRWQNVLKPFALQVWIAIVVGMVATAIVYHLLYRQRQKSFVINCITVVQSLISNPLAAVPESSRVRSFLLVWWVVSWIISVSYTSNLTAVLTVPVFPKTVETIQELVDSDYRLCVLDYGDPAPEALEASDHQVLAGLGRKLDRVPLDFTFEWGGIERCVYKVLNGTHAHFDTYSFVQILFGMLGHGVETYKLRERLYPGYITFLTYKHAPWRNKIDAGLQRLTEGGLIEKWYQDTMNSFREFLSKEKSTNLKPFSLSHLQGPFYMLVGGACISIMAFSGEVFISTRRTSSSFSKR